MIGSERVPMMIEGLERELRVLEGVLEVEFRVLGLFDGGGGVVGGRGRRREAAPEIGQRR